MRDVTMGLQPGTVMGLVGPNGAGKTTLLNILAGIFPPDSGWVWLEDAWVDFDRNPERRRLLGLMLGGRALVEELRTGEYLDFVTAMHGVRLEDVRPTLDHLIRQLRLEAHMDKAIKALSAGTRKKVEFIAAVLHQPRVLLLDEPFEAIDPPAVHELTEVIRQYIAETGAAAIISSHILPYVRPLATEVRLLWRGSLYERDELERLIGEQEDDGELQTWRIVLEGE
ncbi:MAG: ATP-binding cassette domain-containing protein [Tepidiformaceae bacterium]